MKEKVLAHKKMQEGLEQIQKAQEIEGQERVRKIDTKNIESTKGKAGEVKDTYETIPTSRLTNPVEDSMTELEKVEEKVAQHLLQGEKRKGKEED